MWSQEEAEIINIQKEYAVQKELLIRGWKGRRKLNFKGKRKEKEKKIDDMCPNTTWTRNIAGSTFNATRIRDLFCSLGPLS